MPSTLGHMVFNSAQVGTTRIVLMRQIKNGFNVCLPANTRNQPFRHMPFLANHDQQLTVSTNIGLLFPDPSPKPQPLPALAGQKGK